MTLDSPESLTRRSLDPVVGHHGETETDMKIELYCICGATWKGFVSKEGSEAISKAWRETHTGDGHAPATSKQAARARAAEEREYAKQMRREARGE